MDEKDVAHLAGVVDAVGRLTARVEQADTPVGYRLEPVVRLRRPATDRALLGKLVAYCEDRGVVHEAGERPDGDELAFVVTDPASVRAFLAPLRPYLVSERRAAAILVEKIVPPLVDGEPLDRQEFHRIVGYADRLRGVARGADGPDETAPEYTQAFFADLWYDELED